MASCAESRSVEESSWYSLLEVSSPLHNPYGSIAGCAPPLPWSRAARTACPRCEDHEGYLQGLLERMHGPMDRYFRSDACILSRVGELQRRWMQNGSEL